MRLAGKALEDAALGSESPDEGDAADGGDAPEMTEDEAFAEAVDLIAKGDKAGAASALRGAVEMCVASYGKE